ncbi:methyltransferase domain-containing protein [Pseudoalteromonas prydzensis]|uniref:methyltransferase domain-containing protein n=1 Tax=Pseudoalteromonas prydzensis TaxID=182141 RepID=UPI0007E4FD79|nr:methyltransferase domain-containing protein [Pseudoalteromonas prydzensis]MBE0378948.1 malonyl-CoA O-methyltransferase [Pseudoalteromonas prydzensis ACAM 620]
MISPQAIKTKPLSPTTVYLATQALKKTTAHNFSKAANSYSQHANVQKQAANDLFKLISANPKKLCVDLGAGPLVNSQALKALFGQVVAIDLSFNMLKSSNLNTPKLCADMDNLPLQANSIDVLFSNFALQWSANFEILMHSLYQALKPGGQAYISTVVAGSLNEIKTAFAALDSHNHINQFASHNNINQSVEKAGFKINASKKVIYTDQHSSALAAIKSIKAIGATTQNHATSRRGLLTKSALKKVCDAYPLVNNKAHVSYHVVLLSLEKAQ